MNKALLFSLFQDFIMLILFHLMSPNLGNCRHTDVHINENKMKKKFIEIYLIYMYSKTCLIWHALGEIFCVGVDRVLDYNTQCKTHRNRSKGHENQHRITQGNGLHRCWFTQYKTYRIVNQHQIRQGNGLHSVDHKELLINVG